ncbi:hypothetical protein [Breoghania sp.]|uniref:hypothetical protein n=1 Tax=Breoghania sp. TaxID=2065378 RepID=UPI002603FD0F|nr:hypothetical protein [Breoghania sp.]MDJ0931887.1 hypothetical protein [Breoghania sp.]
MFVYKAGQFAWLNIGHSPFSLHENPFSISSAPAERERVCFLIKEVGDFTRTLGTIKPGTVAFMDGPHGHLTIAGRKANGVALIVGRVGLAPLLGIARQAQGEGDTRPMVLIYGNRTQHQIAHRDELEAMSLERETSKVVHVLSEPPDDWQGARGLVSEDIIRASCGGDIPADWLFVLCGSAPMLSAVETLLRCTGVPAHSILSERFDCD